MPSTGPQSNSSLRDNRARNANGSDMSHESCLLDSAMESIKRTFARLATTSLLSGRDGLLPLASKTLTSADDMKLVTWLVVLDPNSDSPQTA